MNFTRLKSSQEFFNPTDTYSIPERLREARLQFDQHGHNFLTPKSVDSEDGQNREEDDEDDKFFSSVTNSCGIFQLAFRRLLSPVLKRLSLRILPSDIEDVDVESASLQFQMEQQLGERIEPLEEQNHQIAFAAPPKVKSYQVMTEMGSVDVMEISLPYKKTVFENFLEERRDLQSLILNEKCASLIWIWSENTRIILITESASQGTWSLKQWYRKILSDMALTDSILIGHPYFWHPVVRRRLNRVIKHFKRLYEILDKREPSHKLEPLPWQIDADMIEPVSTNNNEFDYNPNNSKIFISGLQDKEENVINSMSTKWSDYSRMHAGRLKSKPATATIGDSEQGNNQQGFDNFMNTLTEKIGPPPGDALEMSLGSKFRVEKISRNISSVSSANLSQTTQSTPPAHHHQHRSSRFGKSLRSCSPAVGGSSRSKMLRRSKS